VNGFCDGVGMVVIGCTKWIQNEWLTIYYLVFFLHYVKDGPMAKTNANMIWVQM
jgi:hypothetical protein